jgi:plastocyanin
MVHTTAFGLSITFMTFQTTEKQMKRSILSIISIMTFFGIGLIASAAMADDGPLANATVSFGQWKTDRDPPIDRVITPVPQGAGFVIDKITPDTIKIKEGGAVNFVISGLHNVAVYDVGTKPSDITVGGIFPPLPGAAGGIINDPRNRLYRGLDPNASAPQPPAIPSIRDRVEVVNFAKPGTYLVICGVVNHFVNDDMFSYVVVLPSK